MVKATKTIAQSIILRWIDRNFTGAKAELVGCDKVLMTDRSGESVLLSINLNEDIMNAKTNEILGR